MQGKPPQDEADRPEEETEGSPLVLVLVLLCAAVGVCLLVWGGTIGWILFVLGLILTVLLKLRAMTTAEREEERAAKRKARQEKLKKQREKEKAKKESLKTGKCPNCGGELQVLQKGYDTGTGVACCLLGGPVGLLGGLLGSGKKTRVCKGCGQEFSFGSQKQDSAAAVVVIVLLVVFLLILLASC